MKQPAMLGRGLRVRGKVRGDGDLRIEGDVEGDVSVAGALDLGDGARVQGSLEGEQVTVAGRVEGEVRARGPVSIAATGIVFGDVHAGEVSLEEGGQLHGRIDAEFDLPKEIA
jgi:cytoskeletal protein CcmA (bactofilin family)